MCGISGIISLDRKAVDADHLAAMTNMLSHRGPDDEGMFISPDRMAGLGFRRLAVIDLVGGNQPIANEEGSIHVVCNGEIYNYRTLRQRLAHSHQFRSSGDIEPVVHLYEELGVHFLNELDGFWALALVDMNRRSAMLAVDRFGKKPIYYTFADGALYFASELKALSAAGKTASVDYSAVIDYLRFGWIPAPKTIYQKIFKLQPGQYLRVSFDPGRNIVSGNLPPAVRYYRLSGAKFTGDGDQARRRVRSLLSEAVSKRLVADVPVGVLLSGGMDSTLVTALAAQVSGTAIKTFTVGFEDMLYDERPRAALVAKRYKTDHTEVLIRPDVENLLEMVGSIYDEPFADSSAIPTYLICRQARRHVKVVLTGDGGDEAFCGYDRYRALVISSWLTQLGARPLGRVIERFLPRPGAELRSFRTRFWRLVRSFRFTRARQYSMFLRVFYERQLENLVGPELDVVRSGELDWVAATLDGCTQENSIVMQANLSDYMMYLPYDLLVKIDRASMANGLETRSPFLDPALVEFAVGLPVSCKTNLRRGKRILREAFADLLPAEILTAGKAGFGIPLGNWLRGPLRSQMESNLGRRCRLIRTGLVNNIGLVRLQAEHIAGMHDHGQRLWALMVLEEFLRRIDK
jgi:asparagine synthase (glutamine-hydrolysing)